LLRAGKKDSSRKETRTRTKRTGFDLVTFGERTDFHPNPFFIRFLSEQIMYIIHGPYSCPCMTLGYLGEATRRFRVRFPGGDKCRHVYEEVNLASTTDELRGA
jgi:hypothetical protein